MNRSRTTEQEYFVTNPQATSDTEHDQLETLVRRAISDPASVLPRGKVPHLDDEPESIPNWGMRAVMAVVSDVVAQRDAAVELLQKAVGGPVWPADEDFVAGLEKELDQSRGERGDLNRLVGGLAEILASIEHVPCLYFACPGPVKPSPEPRCSGCDARVALQELLDGVS